MTDMAHQRARGTPCSARRTSNPGRRPRREPRAGDRSLSVPAHGAAPLPAPARPAGTIAPPVPPIAGPGGWRQAMRRGLRTAAWLAAVGYLLAISWYLLAHGGWPTPDYLVPPLLLIAIALGRGWPFVFDWGPFLLLILSWQATAGIADELGRPVHVLGPIAAERWLFGGALPTVGLQARFYDPATAHWYDWAATLQHALHFVLPVAVGLVIWLRGRRLYWRYLASVMTLFYLGFAGYALYPAAPPWMAGLQGEIPPVHRVAVETVLRLPSSAPIGLAYTHFSPNPVAAIPSLHAALPALLVLVLARLWGLRALPLLLYPLTMGVNLVYLGEHYMIDVLLGYALALLAYVLIWELPDLVTVRFSLRRPRVPLAEHWAHLLAGWGRAPVWRVASQLSLLTLAVGACFVVAATLRPGRPAAEAGPVIPGLGVQAGQTGALAPVPCSEGASPSLTVGSYLLPVTGRYAVYLFDVDDAACYTLSANVSFAAPRIERLGALLSRAPVRLAPLPRQPLGIEYRALRTGTAAPALAAAGLAADHRYLLVVLLADVPDPATAATAVDELARLVLIEDPLPAEPEPERPVAGSG